jgi:hypothetical protein
VRSTSFGETSAVDQRFVRMNDFNREERERSTSWWDESVLKNFDTTAKKGSRPVKDRAAALLALKMLEPYRLAMGNGGKVLSH